MQVTEVMSNPGLCAPTTSVRKAASIMRQFDTGILLIVEDVSSRKLVGILTDRDLVLRVLTDRDPEKTTVQECMTHRDLLCCKPEDDIAQVMEAMATRHVRRVPVVSQGKRVVGILTDRDLLQNPEIDSTELCVALRRVTASKIRMPNALDSMTSFP